MTTQTALLNTDQKAQLERLLALREELGDEHQRAMSPAVERALELADIYLFLALGYFGYTERLLPEEE
jgi:hypothetical protein